jgi:hypothetical protein
MGGTFQIPMGGTFPPSVSAFFLDLRLPADTQGVERSSALQKTQKNTPNRTSTLSMICKLAQDRMEPSSRNAETTDPIWDNDQALPVAG